MASTKCINCGGELVFKPETGKLHCERCGAAFDVTDGANKPVIRPYTPSFVAEQNVTETAYQCLFCGAKCIVPVGEERKRCVSCGNTTLQRISSATTAPDGILPFTITKPQAGEIFRNWVGSRKFAPSDLKQMARSKKLIGLYTPVWNFNYDAIWHFSCIGVKKRTDSDGYQYTQRYPVHSDENQPHRNELYSANNRIGTEFVQDLGDYDFTKVKPYSTDYLLGFSGLETTINVHDVYNYMTATITETNERHARERLNAEYDRYENFSCRTAFKNVTFSYTYIPIWANHYIYKGKEYHCYINGQTGKATGKAPKSGWKIGGLVFGILAAIAAITYFVIKLI